MTFSHVGDERVSTRVSRLTRSIGDLQDIVRQFRAKKVALIAVELPIDPPTTAMESFLEMLGVFVELKTNRRRERQMGGRQCQDKYGLNRTQARNARG